MSTQDISQNSQLGKSTCYPTVYSPQILFPIPRRGKRPAFGEDIWTAYELSWINSKSIPEVGILEIRIPSNSSHIIESKSLKLYLNGLNQTQFTNKNELIQTILKDIEEKINSKCKATYYSPEDWQKVKRRNIKGLCLETEKNTNSSSSDLQTVYTHLFRSVCPVTSQPDWATIVIQYTGVKIPHNLLLKHLLSYREHPGFHEECIELIYWHILDQYKPEQLNIQGLFTRRGGIDINPFRSTHNTKALVCRTFRQ